MRIRGEVTFRNNNNLFYDRLKGKQNFCISLDSKHTVDSVLGTWNILYTVK